ncbi:hypothetical protein LAV_00216 [Sphingobium phage Lacusarx]|uniref:Uncharacterized protein n=1 Tax=Sphingobium phage Lacusarx TaxID=1980139 RepID=A0A1W6DXG3_9CAUD|nr:hypothetical protein FDH44_gp087 [Sphingobium phage Lacusarx]ARK07591.1 hypothetical protein LAV_00216 [Sphingobium phage Lacusarx]
MPTAIETARNADFQACPILSDYIAAMLQDLQFYEADAACEEEREERDTGTIYTLAESEYTKCKADCEAFYTANLADIEEAIKLEPGEDGLRYANGRHMTMNRIGYYFYMTRVGHGVTFTDDGDAPCLERLREATKSAGTIETTLGDDGSVYIMGPYKG